MSIVLSTHGARMVKSYGGCSCYLQDDQSAAGAQRKSELLQGPGCHASDGNMVGPSATYVGQQIAMRSLQILVKDKDVHVAFCAAKRLVQV